MTNRRKWFDFSPALAGLTLTVENGLRRYLELSTHNPKTHKGCADNSTYVRTRFSGVDVSRERGAMIFHDLRRFGGMRTAGSGNWFLRAAAQARMAGHRQAELEVFYRRRFVCT